MKLPAFLKQRKWRRLLLVGVVLVVAVALMAVTLPCFMGNKPSKDYEIKDLLGGNIFPSAIISIATTDAAFITPIDTPYVGNVRNGLAVQVTAEKPNSMVRIELEETPFFAKSVSTFVLPKKDVTYTIYPDVLWRYETLRGNEQAEPVSVAMTVELNGESLGQKMRTFSVRSINECLLGYMRTLSSGKTSFVSTRQLFAAYVNEENPLIDQLLREALNTRIVRRFQGYQVGTAQSVDKQVYALWFVLQKRNFKYSSVSYSSLSSNVVWSQRVRTFEDAFKASQINCVDGSVLFASLLRAINITPVLVQIPGHMFVGYYTDSQNKNLTFLETTMIGDVDLDDYFPEEKLDSTMQGKSQSQVSKLTFEKSKEYATNNYQRNESKIKGNQQGYMFVEITKQLRSRIQSIGR